MVIAFIFVDFREVVAARSCETGRGVRYRGRDSQSNKRGKNTQCISVYSLFTLRHSAYLPFYFLFFFFLILFVKLFSNMCENLLLK